MDRLKPAKEDFRYLLDRGYRRSSALDYVCGHYRLGKKDRNVLVRTVFSQKEIRDHKERKVPLGRVKGKTLVVDGYNVLIGAECALGRGRLIESQDGFHRDSLGVFGRYRSGRYTGPALDKLMGVLKRAGPKKVVFYLDSQVSKSGQLAGRIRERLKEYGLEGEVRVVPNVDYEIKSLNRITASSDTGIIEKVDKAVDLVGAL